MMSVDFCFVHFLISSGVFGARCSSAVERLFRVMDCRIDPS